MQIVISADAKAENGSDVQKSRETTVSDLGSLKAKERLDLNCAVKEYLLLAGYRLTAMTFYEEVCAVLLNKGIYFACIWFSVLMLLVNRFKTLIKNVSNYITELQLI